MKVTNISDGPRGLNTKSGPVVLNPKESREDIELSEVEAKIAKGTGWFEMSGKAAKTEPKSEAGLKARHKGGGAYVIMDGDTEVKAGLSRADADTFNAMSDEDKAAYVAA